MRYLSILDLNIGFYQNFPDRVNFPGLESTVQVKNMRKSIGWLVSQIESFIETFF